MHCPRACQNRHADERYSVARPEREVTRGKVARDRKRRGSEVQKAAQAQGQKARSTPASSAADAERSGSSWVAGANSVTSAPLPRPTKKAQKAVCEADQASAVGAVVIDC